MSRTPLAVWLYESQLARLSETSHGRLRLEWTDEARDRWGVGSRVMSAPDAHAFSEPGAAAGQGVPRTGPRPEGNLRTNYALDIGVDPDDTFALISHYGRDIQPARLSSLPWTKPNRTALALTNPSQRNRPQVTAVGDEPCDRQDRRSPVHILERDHEDSRCIGSVSSGCAAVAVSPFYLDPETRPRARASQANLLDTEVLQERGRTQYQAAVRRRVPNLPRRGACHRRRTV